MRTPPIALRLRRRIARATFAVGAMSVVAASCPERLVAQGSLVGVVVMSGDSVRGIADVLVTLSPSDRTVRTDSSGAFRFAEVPGGPYLVSFRKLGFEEAFRTVVAAGSKEAALRVVLTPYAQQLAAVMVSGRRVTYPVRLRDPYLRMSRSAGSFFTREQIDSLFPLDVSSLLVRVPGIRVRSGAIEFARCTELGTNSQRVQVWVDGHRWTNYSSGGDLDVRAFEALRDIRPSSIQLIEIYEGPSRIPPDFLDDACAVILVWRR
jgi:Carboxypeptidase regulatory-like domain/TonB-dependent Receptor Plug Domain